MEFNCSINTLSRMIDHSLLHPTLSDDDLRHGCHLALKYNVATVCIKPYAIPLAREILTNSTVGICTVVSFPHGSNSTAIKVIEVEDAINAGATEIDMVINIGKVMSADWEYVSEEIQAINYTTTARGGILKVIFENDFLHDSQIIKLCEICSEHRVAFVKTSTGYGYVRQIDGTFSYHGATDHHLRLMRKHCAPDVQIKAAGGIKTLKDLLRVRQLGVTRVGATATQTILEEAGRLSDF